MIPDWLATLLGDTSALQLVFWAIAIAALIGMLIKFWPLLTNIVVIVNALVSLPKFMEGTTATLEAQNSKIAEIHHEVNYNNGSSVKDAVHRVEQGVKGIYVRLDSADADRDKLRDDLEHTRPAAVRKRPTKTPTKENP